MKRYIKAWYVGEPSASEYGNALSKGKGYLNEKYSPFQVTLLYHGLNSSGYRITLENQEWILLKPEITWGHDWFLYGPFTPGKYDYYTVESSGMKFSKPFTGLENAMTYLFTTCDVEGA